MAQRYETYKDSGVQWLGEIPSHWGCVPFRRVATVKSNLVHPDEYLELPQVSPDCIEKNSGRLISWKTVADSNVESDNHRFYKGQIIYSKIRPLLNKVIIAPFDGLCSADMYPIETTTDTKYMQYYMLSNLFLSEVRNVTRDRVKMPKINREELGQISIIVPPKTEQHSIVSYLDDKCGKIDEWLSKKQKEVEHLGELKQRVIADAVTRGLNPNVTMKQTNIPWLPEVPGHWECIKMKYLFNERSEKNHPDEVSLCATQTYGVIPQKLYCSYGNRVVEVSKGFELLKFVKEGDFVVHLRSFQGGIEYAYYQGIISPAYTILEPNDANNAPYFKYLFKSYNFIQLLKTCVTGIREGQNINYSMLGNKYLFIPPLSEQKQIVTYITDKTSKIDTLITNINKEIEAIKEYKQRLISDVVTGQIKVC